MTTADTSNQACAACGHGQPLPAIFCSSCGAPLFRISKLLLTLFVTVTVGAFALYGMQDDLSAWPAPLYLYNVFLFVTLALVVCRHSVVTSLRVGLWCLVLIYPMWFMAMPVSRALDLLTSDVRDILDTIERYPPGQMMVLAALLVAFVAGFFALRRRFGFLMAYRCAATLFAMALYGLRWAFSYSIGETPAAVSPRLSDWFLWAPETTVKEMLVLLAVSILRAILAEMAVYSVVKSYGPAMHDYQQKIGAVAGSLPRGGFLLAVHQVVRGLFRSAIFVQHLCICYVRTVGAYLWIMYRIVRRIAIDLVTPVATLLVAAFLLGVLAEYTSAYASGTVPSRLPHPGTAWAAIALVPALIIAAAAVQFVFLAAVGKFRPAVLWDCHMRFMLWLVPYGVSLFLLISLSLAAMGQILRHGEHYRQFPFRMGPLTMAAAVCMALMIALAMFQVRRAAARGDAVQAPQPVPDEPSPAAGTQEPPAAETVEERKEDHTAVDAAEAAAQQPVEPTESAGPGAATDTPSAPQGLAVTVPPPWRDDWKPPAAAPTAHAIRRGTTSVAAARNVRIARILDNRKGSGVMVNGKKYRLLAWYSWICDNYSWAVIQAVGVVVFLLLLLPAGFATALAAAVISSLLVGLPMALLGQLAGVLLDIRALLGGGGGLDDEPEDGESD